MMHFRTRLCPLGHDVRVAMKLPCCHLVQNQMAVEVLEQLRSISAQQSKIRRMREKLALFRQACDSRCCVLYQDLDMSKFLQCASKFAQIMATMGHKLGRGTARFESPSPFRDPRISGASELRPSQGSWRCGCAGIAHVVFGVLAGGGKAGGVLCRATAGAARASCVPSIPRGVHAPVSLLALMLLIQICAASQSTCADSVHGDHRVFQFLVVESTAVDLLTTCLITIIYDDGKVFVAASARATCGVSAELLRARVALL